MIGLTSAEQRYLDLTAELVGLFGEIVGGDVTRAGDIEEHASDIHRLQHRVMAQAAARAHPGSYRLLGRRVGYEGAEPTERPPRTNERARYREARQ